MTVTRILVLVALIVALAVWDGYRIGRQDPWRQLARRDRAKHSRNLR